MFNSHFINIVEKTCGKNPRHFARDNNVSDTRQAIDLIVQSCLDHCNINRIKTTSKNQISSIINYASSSNTLGTNPDEIFELLSVFYIKKLLVLTWFLLNL